MLPRNAVDAESAGGAKRRTSLGNFVINNRIYSLIQYPGGHVATADGRTHTSWDGVPRTRSLSFAGETLSVWQNARATPRE